MSHFSTLMDCGVVADWDVYNPHICGSTSLLTDGAVEDSLLGRGAGPAGRFAHRPASSLLHPTIPAILPASICPASFYGMGIGSQGVTLAPNLVDGAHQWVSDVIYWSHSCCNCNYVRAEMYQFNWKCPLNVSWKTTVCYLVGCSMGAQSHW